MDCLNHFLSWWLLKAPKADFLDPGKTNDTLIMSPILVTLTCATLDFPLNVPVMKSHNTSRTSEAGKEPGGSTLLWDRKRKGWHALIASMPGTFSQIIMKNTSHSWPPAVFQELCLPVLSLEVFTVYMSTWDLSSLFEEMTSLRLSGQSGPYPRPSSINR